MATISSLGVGSGLDAETIVSKLMTLESQPLTAIAKKQSSVNAKISAFGSLRSLLDTLRTKANVLGTQNKLAAFTATSSSTDILSATASSTAVSGSYAINVQRLATAHKMTHATAITGDSTAVINSSGSAQTFTLQLAGATSPTVISIANGSTLGDLRNAINNSTAGVKANIVTSQNGGVTESHLVLTASETGKTITTSTTLAGFGGFRTAGGEDGKHAILSQTAFAGGADVVGPGVLKISVGSNAPVSVTVSGASASLQDVADAINGASAGVTASLVTDTTGTHLKLVSDTTDQLVSYTAEDTTGSTVDNYNFARLSGFTDSGDPPQIAQSALLTIEGQSVTSTSNKISSSISGVTFELKKTGATTLTVDRDQSAVSTAVDEFVSAYNALNSKIRSLTAYDSANKKGNTLTGDAATRNIQAQMTAILTSKPDTSSGTYSYLSDLGITTSADGNLSVNSTKLTAAIDTDFSSVSSVLNRFGSALYTKIGDFTATIGILSSKTDNL